MVSSRPWVGSQALAIPPENALDVSVSSAPFNVLYKVLPHPSHSLYFLYNSSVIVEALGPTSLNFPFWFTGNIQKSKNKHSLSFSRQVETRMALLTWGKSVCGGEEKQKYCYFDYVMYEGSLGIYWFLNDKELAHRVMELGKSKICRVGWWSWDPGELMVHFGSKAIGWTASNSLLHLCSSRFGSLLAFCSI